MFMIHVALHWDEQGSDMITLWPFAVCHATWLYNQLPNGVTGLSPLEILTGNWPDHMIFFELMFGIALSLFLILRFRMSIKFWDGIAGHARGSFYASLMSTHPWLRVFATCLHAIEVHNFTLFLMIVSTLFMAVGRMTKLLTLFVISCGKMILKYTLRMNFAWMGHWSTLLLFK